MQQGFYICSCSQRICLGLGMAWDGPDCATGLWHTPAQWQGGMAGVPGVLQCLLPALAVPGRTNCFHHLLIWEGSGSRSGGSHSLRPENKARRTWNFSQSACTFPSRASPCPRTTLSAGSGIISTRREHLLQSGSEQSSQALISFQIVLWRLLLLFNRDLGCLKLAVVARGCLCHPHLLPGALGAGLSLPG